MDKGNTNGISHTPAKIISVIFHPLVIPLYGLLIIFLAPTLFWYIPFKVKKILFLVVLTNNILIPVSLLPFFRYRNIISSWMIETREERIIPLLAVSFFYSLTSVIIFRLPVPVFIKGYIFSISIITVTATIINFWSKISLRSIGAGALNAVVIILSIKTQVPLTFILLGTLIIGGLVLSSRLKLNSHNPQQVYLGFLIGFTGIFGFMQLF
jgi:hypothetical protein